MARQIVWRAVFNIHKFAIFTNANG